LYATITQRETGKEKYSGGVAIQRGVALIDKPTALVCKPTRATTSDHVAFVLMAMT
jgi:hypothetical protein